MIPDASAVVEYLLGTTRGKRASATLTDPDVELHVPALCDIEISSALRAAERRRLIDTERAQRALDGYLDLPFTRHLHVPVLRRAFELRQNFSLYDAIYVALAEALGGPLLTADARLASAARSFSDVGIVEF